MRYLSITLEKLETRKQVPEFVNYVFFNLRNLLYLIVENAIRPFVIVRKEWLFADTLQGAEASAIIYSLMETAKANSLRLDDYLLHLLSILPERAERNKDFEADDLLPWSEEMKSWFSAV